MCECKHLQLCYFVSDFHDFFPIFRANELGILFTILDFPLSILDLYGADIWPQIRPRKIPDLNKLSEMSHY